MQYQQTKWIFVITNSDQLNPCFILNVSFPFIHNKMIIFVNMFCKLYMFLRLTETFLCWPSWPACLFLLSSSTPWTLCRRTATTWPKPCPPWFLRGAPCCAGTRWRSGALQRPCCSRRLWRNTAKTSPTFARTLWASLSFWHAQRFMICPSADILFFHLQLMRRSGQFDRTSYT